MNISKDDNYIYIHIPNPNVGTDKDLIRFYSHEYFELVGLYPEIYMSDSNEINLQKQRQTQKGGYFQNIGEVTVPYKYFVYMMEYNPIAVLAKNASTYRDDFFTSLNKKKEVVASSLEASTHALDPLKNGFDNFQKKMQNVFKQKNKDISHQEHRQIWDFLCQQL
jgi:hypothetical protein